MGCRRHLWGDGRPRRGRLRWATEAGRCWGLWWRGKLAGRRRLRGGRPRLRGAWVGSHWRRERVDLLRGARGGRRRSLLRRRRGRHWGSPLLGRRWPTRLPRGRRHRSAGLRARRVRLGRWRGRLPGRLLVGRGPSRVLSWRPLTRRWRPGRRRRDRAFERRYRSAGDVDHRPVGLPRRTAEPDQHLFEGESEIVGLRFRGGRGLGDLLT